MRKGENLWGYINPSGEFTISPRFESYPNGYVSSFSEGLARISVRGKDGYIDHSGAFLIQPQFPEGADFHDGMARVVTEGPVCIGRKGLAEAPSRWAENLMNTGRASSLILIEPVVL